MSSRIIEETPCEHGFTKETCSCGSVLEIGGSEPPYRWNDQYQRYLALVADWRENHLHVERAEGVVVEVEE